MHRISDPASVELVARLRRRRSGPDELLAYRASRSWRTLGSDAINQYIKAALGPRFSAKDFRTWNATVLVAALLGVEANAYARQRQRERTAARVIKQAAVALGNTPAVARASYVDPRVIERYLAGQAITLTATAAELLDTLPDRRRRALELAVLELLARS